MIEINKDIKIHYPLTLIPRKQQLEAFEYVKKSLNSGKQNILLNSPTGSGKSYLAIMVINYYLNSINPDAKIDILTNSKILQKQYIKDYPYIKNYEGRSNYHCEPHDTDCSKGVEICNVLGGKCKDCPYMVAKSAWIDAKIGLTNFHLYNTLAVYLNSTLVEKESTVLFVDEAHDFESVFCDFISTNLSARNMKKYGFNLKEIEEYDRTILRIKNIEKYVGFVQNQFCGDIKHKMSWLEGAIEKAAPKLRQQYSKYKSHCELQLAKYEYFLKEYDKNKQNWVLDITKTNDKIYSNILLEVKPVWGREYIKEMVFDKYDHVIFMSGSILDKELFSYINGLSDEDTSYYDTPSTFPLNRRPIYYIKVGKMNWENKEKTFKKQIEYIDKILKKNKDKKGIIHIGTYELLEKLQQQYINKRLLFHTPENRDEMLKKHINANYPSVIVSPSMGTGVDLKDDLSRFQIIVKIPFPYLGSNKIKLRQKSNPKWYSWKTVVDIIQQYGRSIRSNEDWAETFILDSNFSDLIKYNGKIMPRWFTDAIKILKN